MLTARQIGSLILRIQNDFLDTPALRLTLRDAVLQFDIDPITCHAILGALVDAQVLARSHDGEYVRHAPRHAHAA